MIIICVLDVSAYGQHDFSGRLSEKYVDKNLNEISELIEITCEICFITEIAFEVLARGLWQGRRAFFKNPWLVCNLISIICR